MTSTRHSGSPLYNGSWCSRCCTLPTHAPLESGVDACETRHVLAHAGGGEARLAIPCVERQDGPLNHGDFVPPCLHLVVGRPARYPGCPANQARAAEACTLAVVHTLGTMGTMFTSVITGAGGGWVVLSAKTHVHRRRAHNYVCVRARARLTGRTRNISGTPAAFDQEAHRGRSLSTFFPWACAE